MLKFRTHRNFDKSYKKRIYPHPNLDKKFKTRLQEFLIDPKNLTLKDHQLTGNLKNYRSFWITGDIRVIYNKQKSTIILFDIGSHNQVY